MENEASRIASRVKLVCSIGVGRDEDFRLPFLYHFLRHYLGLGVPASNFLITLHATDDSDLLSPAAVIRNFGILKIRTRRESYDCHLFHDAILAAITSCAHDDWVLCVDFDEYVELPFELPELISQLETRNLNAMKGTLVDRISEDGGLPEVRLEPGLWQQFPLAAPLTGELVAGCAEKVCLFQAPLKPRLGHHFLTDDSEARFARGTMNVHHFKWDATLVPRLERTRRRFAQEPERYYWRDEVDRALAGLRDGRIPERLMAKVYRPPLPLGGNALRGGPGSEFKQERRGLMET